MKVLYIGGSGRSGSTLLDRVIGQIPGYTSAGEVRDIWRDAAGENRLCGCGQEVDRCPFWERVGAEAFGGWSRLDRDETWKLVTSFGYPKALRALWSPSRSLSPSHRRFAELMECLYGGMAVAADGATIVDSSKGLPYGIVLGSIPSIDMRAIHLVRDSRGVAYSWSKEMTRADSPGRTEQMPRIGIAGVSARWIAHNTLMELLGRRVPVARLRYETFIERPKQELLRVLGELGWPLEGSELAFLRERSVWLEPNHTVMGNPMRVSTGEIPLRLDDAWRTSLPRAQRAQVTAATLPMLIRYGYRP